MSAIVKMVTPFMEQELLVNALHALGVQYTLMLKNQAQTIVTDRVDYRGNQLFVWDGTRFIFQYDSDANRTNSLWGIAQQKNWKPVAQFLEEVEKEYKHQYTLKMQRLEEERLEEERRRMEEARIAYVEKQTAEVKARAEKMGYKVTEKKVGNKTQLVLIKNTY